MGFGNDSLLPNLYLCSFKVPCVSFNSIANGHSLGIGLSSILFMVK